jgi:hypothetical protein
MVDLANRNRDMKLLPLDIFITPEKRVRLFDKVVERVTELRSPILRTIVSWQGETEDGYFAAAMIGGTVSLNWAEREYQIRYNLVEACYVGGTQSAIDLISKPNTDEAFVSAVSELSNLKQMSVDAQNVRFEDVMSLVNWRYKNDSVTVENSIA